MTFAYHIYIASLLLFNAMQYATPFNSELKVGGSLYLLHILVWPTIFLFIFCEWYYMYF